MCKTENLESQWCNSVWVWRPEIWGATGVSPGVWQPENQELQCPRAREDGRPNSRRERIRPSSAFGWCPPTLVRKGLLYSIYWITINILTDIPRNNVLPGIWAFFNSVNFTHEVNHHSKNVEKREPSYVAGGSVKWYNCCGKVFQRVKYRIIIGPRFIVLRYIAKKMENMLTQKLVHICS